MNSNKDTLSKPLFDMVSSGMPGQVEAVAHALGEMKRCYICEEPHARKKKTCSDRCEEAYLGNRTLRAEILKEKHHG